MSKSPTSEVKHKLTDVRLSFPRLFTPEAFEEGGTKTFQATFLLDPSNEEHKRVLKNIQKDALRLAKEAFGADFTLKQLKGMCFGKGDDLPKVYDGYEGMYYVRTANTVRPAVANRRGEPVAEGDPQEPYAGCFVNGTLSLWVQNNKWGKRINANLRGVQFVRDGEAFGQEPISAENEFEALDDNSPADDFDDDFDMEDDDLDL
jgi:hypothetical protein